MPLLLVCRRGPLFHHYPCDLPHALDHCGMDSFQKHEILSADFSDDSPAQTPILKKKHSAILVKPVCLTSTPCDFNLLVLGGVGVGKATVVNEMFGTEVFKSDSASEVVEGVSQRDSCFTQNNTRHRVRMFDTVGSKKHGVKVKRANTMEAIRKYVSDVYPSGINLVLLIYRNESFTSRERKRFQYFLDRFNKEAIPMITALIITGCEDKNDSARKKIVSEFDTNSSMQEIGRFVLMGIYTVGLTNLSTVPDALTEMYRAVNYRDTLLLQEVLKKSYWRQMDRDVFFYRGHPCKLYCCKCPWQYCPCYDRIYSCWRWGYSWEDCLHVSHD